jgi:hypothetical protein
VNVTTVFALLKEADPLTGLLLASLSVNVTEDGVTAWLNVALGATDTATPVALEAGDVDETAGAAGADAVVKLQE